MLQDPVMFDKLFFKMETVKKDGTKTHRVRVKLDSKAEKTEPIPVEELHNYFLERGDMRIYNYFQALIRLSAAVCLQRNYKCITRL